MTWAVLLLTACQGLTALNGGGTTSGDVAIDSLVPDWGPPAGGTTVTIHGAGFDDTSKVHFGDAIVPSTLVNPDTLTVTSPASTEEITVDVTIENASGTGSATRKDAFTYSETPA